MDGKGPALGPFSRAMDVSFYAALRVQPRISNFGYAPPGAPISNRGASAPRTPPQLPPPRARHERSDSAVDPSGNQGDGGDHGRVATDDDRLYAGRAALQRGVA